MDKNNIIIFSIICPHRFFFLLRVFGFGDDPVSVVRFQFDLLSPLSRRVCNLQEEISLLYKELLRHTTLKGAFSVVPLVAVKLGE